MTTTLNKLQNHRMVNTCVVPGCESRSDRDHHLSFHLLPLKNIPLLKKWLHQIGRKNVPLNKNSRVCSRHFKNSRLCKLHSDEYPTENLPRLATRATTSTPRTPLVRRQLVEDERDDDDTGDNDRVEPPPTQDVGVNTVGDEIEWLEAKIHDLEDEIKVLTESDRSRFSLESIANDDTKVMFYTGFPSYDHLKICFDFLGPATKQLIYMYRDSMSV